MTRQSSCFFIKAAITSLVFLLCFYSNKTSDIQRFLCHHFLLSSGTLKAFKVVTSDVEKLLIHIRGLNLSELM